MDVIVKGIGQLASKKSMDDKVDKDRQGARVKTGIQSYHHGSRCATAKEEKLAQEVS